VPSAYSKLIGMSAAYSLPLISRSIIIFVIEWYQRYLSPRKGYCCAYRVAHKRCSCSHYGKRVVQRRGALAFVPLMQRRFARCAKAAAKLRANEVRVLDYAGRPQQIKSSPLQYREAATCNPDSDGLCCFAAEISPYLLEALGSC